MGVIIEVNKVGILSEMVEMLSELELKESEE